jgi:hypothetical protein
MLAMNSANPGGAKIANYGTVPVSVFALDRVIDGEKPAMMKIDVEGYELEVLRGAHRTLQHEPVLVVEYNRGPHRNRLYRFLTERGYSLYIVSERLAFNWMRMPFVASDFENVVAVPKRLRHVVSPATALDYPHILVWLRYGPPRSIALWFLHLFGLKRRPRPPAPSAPAPGVGLHKIGGGDVNQRDLVAVGEGEHGVRPDLR